MPVLKNPKHEAFAVARVKGLSADAAYAEAGYSKNRGNAARLNADESILKRITELQDKVVDKLVEETSLDKSYVLTTIHDTIERCRQARQVFDRKGDPVMIETPTGQIVPAFVFDAKSVLRGAELIGKDLGMFKESLELSGKNGGPIKTEDINGRELARRLASALARVA